MLIGMSAFAQDELDLIQTMYGMEKKQILEGFLDFSSEEAKETFWTLYTDYENQRKEFGKQRVNLLDRYVSDYMNMSDTEMDALLTEVTKMRTGFDKLLISNVKKIKKKVGVKQAAQFYQIESYLNNAINLSIMERIPFIGELDQ